MAKISVFRTAAAADEFQHKFVASKHDVIVALVVSCGFPAKHDSCVDVVNPASWVLLCESDSRDNREGGVIVTM